MCTTSLTQRTGRSSLRTRLFALPPEICNKIYEIMFKFPRPMALLPSSERNPLQANDVKVDELLENRSEYIVVLHNIGNFIAM